MARAGTGEVWRSAQRNWKTSLASRPARIRPPCLSRPTPGLPRAGHDRHQCHQQRNRAFSAADVAAHSLRGRPRRRLTRAALRRAARCGPRHPARNPGRAAAGAHRHRPRPPPGAERPQGSHLRANRSGRPAPNPPTTRHLARFMSHRALRLRRRRHSRRHTRRGHGRAGHHRRKSRPPEPRLDFARGHSRRDAGMAARARLGCRFPTLVRRHRRDHRAHTLDRTPPGLASPLPPRALRGHMAGFRTSSESPSRSPVPRRSARCR